LERVKSLISLTEYRIAKDRFSSTANAAQIVAGGVQGLLIVRMAEKRDSTGRWCFVERL
jgi:hypothetical protein